MKKNLTELVFLLDRSGSMTGLESDTIGGYNAMLEKQKETAGEVVMTTVLFDDSYELLHDRVNLKDVAPITEEEYFVRGSTALLDALGMTINRIGEALNHTVEEERPEHVLFVVTTDGMENASKEFSYKRVRKLIENQKNKYSWEFVFLGANIDAKETAKNFGINRDRATNYVPDSKGTQLNYEAINNMVFSMRRCGEISENWDDSIANDYEKRGEKK